MRGRRSVMAAGVKHAASRRPQRLSDLAQPIQRSGTGECRGEKFFRISICDCTLHYSASFNRSLMAEISVTHRRRSA